MTEPEGQKDLWKHIEWKNKQEKEAFYNKYFKGGEFETKRIKNAVIKDNDRILNYIENTKDVTEGKIKRPLQIKDIIKMING